MGAYHYCDSVRCLSAFPDELDISARGKTCGVYREIESKSSRRQERKSVKVKMVPDHFVKVFISCGAEELGVHHQ